MNKVRAARTQFIVALGLASLVSLSFYAYSALRNHSFEYSYLVWNLFLAWLPLAFAVRLRTILAKKDWSSWEGIIYSALWLVFLPNSFYMISDFIHLQEVARVDLLFDVLMFTSFIYTGVVLGFASLYTVHLELRERFSERATAGVLAIVLWLCSGAIYIGRDLRWNSWDIVTNPGGLLFDISDRLAHPAAYPQMLVTTVSFFVLLSTMYILLWRGIQLLQRAKVSDL